LKCHGKGRRVRMDLDKKIDDIYDEWSDRTFEMAGDRLEFRMMVVKAFQDAGWKHDGFSEAYEHVLKKRNDGIEPTWVKIFGFRFLTGQEWYDRFHEESLKLGYKQLTEAVESAAKKAAGLE
jgi:hypothetical protein